ncbi:MAG: hypothetical protein LUC24_02930 [Bacteroidales bacterium]|nr:hypothetical protein [Bacteroidales bacterium]
MSRNKRPLLIVSTYAEIIVCCIIPALVFGCSSDPEVNVAEGSEEEAEFSVRLLSDSDCENAHTDVFIFNNDALRRIDAYQRVSGTSFKASSRVGEKLLVAIANSSLGSGDWRRISSYDGLMEEMSMLEDEDADCPVMSAQTEISAGTEESYELDMTRIMSKVRVRTLCTDFHATEFDGEPFTDAKVYLTNVNASCAIMREENFRPVMIVNPGYLDYGAIEGFRSGSMLWSDVPFDLTSSAMDADISLYCYPNDTPEETYGSPFTRLVLEGKICGVTCYYPITVNREENGVCFGGEGNGIGRNCCYTFDITICRFGTSDPDTPVNKEDVIINCSVEPWTEKDSQTIIF